jgi:hypothetical protein
VRAKRRLAALGLAVLSLLGCGGRDRTWRELLLQRERFLGSVLASPSIAAVSTADRTRLLSERLLVWRGGAWVDL